jgi:hypothetical protein
MFENTVLRKIFGLKPREEWRKFHDEELYNLDPLSHRVIKVRELR